MKLIAAAIGILITFAGPLWSDDTHIEFGIGGVKYFSDVEDQQIQLKYEKIDIHFLKDKIEFSIDFDFFNSGDEVEYEIGFPVHDLITIPMDPKNVKTDITLDGFRTSVNGVSVPFEKTEKTKEVNVQSWFTKKVAFQSQKITRVNVSYSSESLRVHSSQFYCGC